MDDEKGQVIQLDKEEVEQGGDHKEREEDEAGVGERGVRKEINDKQEEKPDKKGENKGKENKGKEVRRSRL